MTTVTETPLVAVFDLLALYAQRFPEDRVDCDMRGNPISAARVLIVGAHGPAARRLLELVAQESGGPVTKERLVELSAVAFPAAEDRDFAGHIITNHSIILAEPHGFGIPMLKLAQLVPVLLAQGVTNGTDGA